MDGSKISTEESSQLQQEIPKSHHADLHPRWTNELDFTHFDALPHFAKSPPLSGRERVIFWIKGHFVWLVYLTMIIQLGANIGVVAALPGILTSDVRYLRLPLTQNVVVSQTIPMLAACFINHLILGEWHIVRRRHHLDPGDMFGIVGVILLFVTAVSIDASRLMQSHIDLVQLRHDDGNNSTNYNIRCFETYFALVTDLDHVTITPARRLINNYQCCSGNSGKKSVEQSRILFAAFVPDKAKRTNFTMNTLVSQGFRCCSSRCRCNSLNDSNFTICLTKFLDEMSGLYAATYPIYVVFVLASLSSVLAFIFYNNQVIHGQ